jgi:hypothetical protein
MSVGVTDLHRNLTPDIRVASGIGAGGRPGNSHSVAKPLVAEDTKPVGISYTAGVRRQGLIFSGCAGDSRRANRRIVDRRYVDGDNVRRRVFADPTVGDTAIVLNLESEAGVAGTGGVGNRCVGKQSGIDIDNCDPVIGSEGRTVPHELTLAGQSGDPDT